MATATSPHQATCMPGSGGPECPQVDRVNRVFQGGAHGPNGLPGAASAGAIVGWVAAVVEQMRGGCRSAWQSCDRDEFFVAGGSLLLSPGNPVPAASVMGLPVFLFNNNTRRLRRVTFKGAYRNVVS